MYLADIIEDWGRENKVKVIALEELQGAATLAGSKRNAAAENC